MKVDNIAGYAVDASVNCDSVDGTLRTSKSGKVYKETVGKYKSGSDISNKISAGIEDCLKYCEDTTGCVSVDYYKNTRKCIAGNANSCDGSLGSNGGLILYELAEVLSRTCTSQNKNDIFPSSYAFATKTFKIE